MGKKLLTRWEASWRRRADNVTAYFDSCAISPKYSPIRRLGNRAEGGLGSSCNWTRTLANTSARYTPVYYTVLQLLNTRKPHKVTNFSLANENRAQSSERSLNTEPNALVD